MAPRLVLLCGPAFSGKSTLARALETRLGTVVVSYDDRNAARGLWGGDGVSAEEWGRTHRDAVADVERHLRAGAPLVVVDDTLCFRSLRDDYRRLANAHGVRADLVVLRLPEETIRRRMRENEETAARKGLRPEVFDEHLRTFEWPGEDEELTFLATEEDVESFGRA